MTDYTKTRAKIREAKRVIDLIAADLDEIYALANEPDTDPQTIMSRLTQDNIKANAKAIPGKLVDIYGEAVQAERKDKNLDPM